MSTAVLPDPGTGTPEPIVPDAAALAAQAQAEAETARLAAEKAAKPAVPETYTLTAPDGVTLDAAFTDRTAAIARELGLSQDAAQKLHTERITEAAAQDTAQRQLIEAWKPGGTEWLKRNEQWTTQAKADPEIGKTPEEFATTVEKAQQGLARIDPAGQLKALFDETGYGSHPVVIKALAVIGRAMSEPGMVLGGSGGGSKPKTDAQVMFPSLYNDDGTPKAAA